MYLSTVEESYSGSVAFWFYGLCGEGDACHCWLQQIIFSFCTPHHSVCKKALKSIINFNVIVFLVGTGGR